MNMSNCNLCGEVGVSKPDQSRNSDMYNVSCPNCGRYSIAGLEALQIPCLPPTEKERLQAIVAKRSADAIRVIIVDQQTANSTGGQTIRDLLCSTA